jgi:hypothetical protein
MPRFLFASSRFLFEVPRFLFETSRVIQEMPHFLFASSHFLFEVPRFLFETSRVIQEMPHFLFASSHFLFEVPRFLFETPHVIQEMPRFLFASSRFLFEVPRFLFGMAYSKQGMPRCKPVLPQNSFDPGHDRKAPTRCGFANCLVLTRHVQEIDTGCVRATTRISFSKGQSVQLGRSGSAAGEGCAAARPCRSRFSLGNGIICKAGDGMAFFSAGLEAAALLGTGNNKCQSWAERLYFGNPE